MHLVWCDDDYMAILADELLCIGTTLSTKGGKPVWHTCKEMAEGSAYVS